MLYEALMACVLLDSAWAILDHLWNKPYTDVKADVGQPSKGLTTGVVLSYISTMDRQAWYCLISVQWAGLCDDRAAIYGKHERIKFLFKVPYPQLELLTWILGPTLYLVSQSWCRYMLLGWGIHRCKVKDHGSREPIFQLQCIQGAIVVETWKS